MDRRPPVRAAAGPQAPAVTRHGSPSCGPEPERRELLVSEPRNAAGLSSLAPKLAGASAGAGRRRVGRRAPSMEPRRRSAARRRRARPWRRRRSRHGRLRARARPPGRPQADRARGGGHRLPREHDPPANRADGRRGDRRGRPPGAGGSRRALGRRGCQGRRARTGGRTRLRGPGGRRRIHARRRTRLAQPPSWPGREQRARRGGGHGRRRAGASRPRQRARPVLGAARRGWQLRRGDRARVLALPADRGLCGHDRLARRARRRGDPGLPRLDSQSSRTR